MTVRMRHTRSHTAQRRAHHALGTPAVAKDKKTGDLYMKHRVSLTTGMYAGRQVIDVNKKLDKKIKKRESRMKDAGAR